MCKRILASIMTLIILVSFFNVSKFPAFAAENINYIDYTYDEINGLTHSEKTASATKVTSSTTSMNNNFYYVAPNTSVEINDTVSTGGTTHLILCDGSTLTCKKGIVVKRNSDFFIYGQNAQTGKLFAIGDHSDNEHVTAGIGDSSNFYSDDYIDYGNITINGGIISATGGYWQNEQGTVAIGSPGIGGIDEFGEKLEGSITINNGDVTAIGANKAAGIGGGGLGYSSNVNNYNSPALFSSITINGGTIKATGGNYGAGIGGGRDNNAENITINGGTITATATTNGTPGETGGAGIGGGCGGNATNIKITGGIVNTTGSPQGAGIGCGLNVDGLVKANGITITGGKVTAKGGQGAAGIGGSFGCSAENIVINKGTIVSTPGADDQYFSIQAAGIGNGAIGTAKTSSFSTDLDGKEGSAFITTTSITDMTKEGSWKGMIHLTKSKKWVFGGTVSCNEPVNVESGETLTINQGGRLNQSNTLTNAGTLENNGTLNITSTFTNNGTFTNSANAKMIIDGKLTSSGSVNWTSKDVTGKGLIEPEAKKLPASITVPNISLSQDFDNNNNQLKAENLSKVRTAYSAYGKDGAGTLNVIYKKNGQTLTQAPTEAGDYTISLSATSGNFYQAVPESSKTISYTINRVGPEITEPKPIENLVYTGHEKELITAGTTSAGKMLYSLDNEENYLEEIPKATNAGEYTVYYKVIADGTEYKEDNWFVKVTIGKAISSTTNIPQGIEDLVYTGTSQELIIAPDDISNGHIEYKLGEDGEYSADIPTGTNAGTYTIYYKIIGDENFDDTEEKSLTVEIAKADPKLTKPTGATLEYTGEAQELIKPGKILNLSNEQIAVFEYSVNGGEYSEEIPKASELGKYEISYKAQFAGDENYNSIEIEDKLTVSIEIFRGAAQKSPEAPQMQTRTQNSITLKTIEPNENGAIVEYKIIDGDWQKSNVFQGLKANTEYTFVARYAATEDGKYAASSESPQTKISTLQESNGGNSGGSGSTGGSGGGGSSSENPGDNSSDNNKDDEEKLDNTIFTVRSKIESVQIKNGKTEKIKYPSGTANITIKKLNDNLDVKIKDENGNELNADSKIVLIAAQNNYTPGTVAITTNDKVVRKSIVRGGKIYIPLKNSSVFKVIDNNKSFYDVSQSHWANNAIAFASAHELFNGTAPNIFETEIPMSRAMLTQVLYNLEDNPYQAYENIFSDVNFEDWFAEPITWAATHRGTIIGYDDGRFGPNDSITREQLATILYRYFGENEIVDTELNFVDAYQISDYALNAMKWAVKYEIIQGKGDNILDPQGLATRAEVAQMFKNLLMNFILKPFFS